MATETERLERETEQTRAQLEQTLGELRARMSPGHLFDQASDYFRNSGGRTYLHNLREEVVHNPVPITLIGAGMAWLAISGAMGRRGNGRSHGHEDMARDWGRTAGISDDLAHGGHGPSAMRRAKETAQHWAHDARDTAESWVDQARATVSGAEDTVSETGERWRESASDLGDRVGTAYDETVGQTRETLREGAASVRDSASHLGERAGELYERTASGFRRVGRKAAHYGHAARDAVQPDGALLQFCREQPLVVAGLGLAFGAALAAMIPSSRVERETMGDASRKVQDRIKQTASDTYRAATGERSGQDASEQSSGDQGSWREDRFEQAANDGDSAATQPSGIGRSEQPGNAMRRESWQSESMGSREAAADVERGVKQSDRASNIESEPGRAPYAEAAEAGAAGSGTMAGEETKQRT